MDKLKIINPSGEGMESTLGLSQERAYELSKMLSQEFIDGYKKDLDFTTVLKSLTDKCNHINEVVFCSFSYGRIVKDFEHDPGTFVGAVIMCEISYEDYCEAHKIS